jgi:hypothetical protein
VKSLEYNTTSLADVAGGGGDVDDELAVVNVRVAELVVRFAFVRETIRQ